MSVKLFKIISFSVIAVIMAIVITLNIACIAMADVINLWIIGESVDVDDETVEYIRQEGEALAEQIMGEGAVLVKNDDVLPLSKTDDKKVNVFGWSSTQWIGSGSGSGRVIQDKLADNQYIEVKTGLLEALTNQGYEYNTEITNMYKSYLDVRPYNRKGNNYGDGALKSFDYQFSRLYEPSINDTTYYTSSLLENARQNSTALVVIGRISGESIDCPKVQYKGVKTGTDEAIPDDTTRTYLEISTEEEALLTYVGANYEKVIVIINSTNTMELGFMETIEGLDACLVVGGTGINAANAIPKILYGDITPSGKLSDTYAYDLATSSSYANSGADGQNFFTDGGTLYPATINHPNAGAANVKFGGVSYVDYVEGIYVGYRWYETANEMNYWDEVDNEYGKGYDGVVQYPFGFGLSYTSFAWDVQEVVPAVGSNLAKDGKISIKVMVTNTGEVAGKDVVSAYFTAPYSENGIEKSSVTLGAFTKTKLLEPNESQLVLLTFKVEDMASYDYNDANKNGFKGYELEVGDYEVKLMKNSHELAELTPSELAVISDPTITYKVNKDIRYENDTVTGTKVENIFTGDDAIDGFSIDGSGGTVPIQYMTRSNFSGTFPKQITSPRAMSAKEKSLNLYTAADANAWINPDDEDIVVSERNDMLVYQSNQITELGMQLGANYNDPLWDKLMEQVSLYEMRNVALHGFTKTMAVASVGKPQTRDVDGPGQIGSFNVSSSGTGFPMATIVAQTFNVQLAYDFGLAIGKEANVKGYEGWYGPGINLHRSPLSGRNYEYYSEDPLLSGLMCARAITAARNTGVYAYLKHLAVYDQETNRDGLYTYLTEQALREVYLKPFKIAVQQGGATGIMTSYNRLGAVWAGGSYGLITKLLREEWGFKGAVLTDYSDNTQYMNGDQSLRAGGDIWMDGWQSNGSFRYETTSNTFKREVQRATKNVIYMWLNAVYTNAVYNADEDNRDPVIKLSKEKNFAWWIPALIGVDIVAVGGCGVWGFMAFKKKED